MKDIPGFAEFFIPGFAASLRIAGHSCIFMSYDGELFKRERPN